MRDQRKAKRFGGGRRLSAGIAVSFTALLTAGVASAGFIASAASAATSKAAPRASSTGLVYTPLSPQRIADTRCGASPAPSFCASENLPSANSALKTVAAGGTINVAMPSAVPSNASAAVFNVTAVDQTGPGFLTVYATGGTQPVVSNLNFNAAQSTFGASNLVTVPLGSSSITVFNGPTTGGASVDVIVDLEGYYAPPSGSSLVGEYFPLTPTRILDTRGSGGTPLGANSTGNLTVVGANNDGVPASASAVLLNVTVTDTTGSSFLTAWPAGATQPVVSNLNWTSGETLANKVLIPLGSGGSNAGAISLYNLAGNTDVVVDVMGYFSGSGGTTAGDLFTPVTPARMADTRCGASPAPSFCASENLPSGNASLTSPSGGQSITVGITGNDGVPSGAAAAAVDVIDVSPAGSTSSPPTGGNFLTVYAAGSTLPGTSDVNWVPGDVYNVVANGAYGGLSSAGAMAVYQGPTTAGTTDVVMDLFGYFAPASAPPVAQSYTVTGPTPSATPTVSTSSSTAGDVTYTVTGFTSSNTPNGYVDIALFPSTGTNAPVTSGGATTFVSSGGSGVAGSAKGEANSNNQTTTTVAAPNQGAACVTGSSCFAYVASINGVPTANAPDLVKSVAVTAGGTLTFVVNSFQVDGTIPVVFTEPTATATGTLQLGTNGQPATGYSYGTGSAVNWSVNAPAASPGTFTNWVVNSVNNTADTFVACANGTSPLFCYTFTDNVAGSTYTYTDIGGSPGSITLAAFQSFLSGGVTQTNSLPSPVLGDEVSVTPYGGSSGLSTFAFSNGLAASSCTACTIVGTPTAPSGQADVPAAPSSLAPSTSTTPSGEQLSWTAPVNQDVTTDSTALYNVYVAPVTGTPPTVGAYTKAGTVSNASTPVVTGFGVFTLANCATASPTCVVITSGLTAGDTYSVVVSATSGTKNGNVAEEGPVSNAPQFTTSSTPPPSLTLTPVAIATSVSNGSNATNQGALQSGDTFSVQFANGPITVSPTSTFTFVGTNGASGTVTCGTNATCAGSGTNILSVTMTAAPVITNIGSGLDAGSLDFGCTGILTCVGLLPSTSDIAFASASGITNTVGAWNLPGGNPSGTSNTANSPAFRVLTLNAPTPLLPAASVRTNVDCTSPATTAVADGCTSITVGAGDPAVVGAGTTISVYDGNGNLLGTGTVATAGSATAISLSRALASSDTAIQIVYTAAQSGSVVAQPSQTLLMTFPHIKTAAGVGGSTTITLTYDQAVVCNNLAAAAAQFTVSGGVTVSAVTCNTVVGTGSVTVTLTTSALPATGTPLTVTYSQSATVTTVGAAGPRATSADTHQDATGSQSVAFITG